MSADAMTDSDVSSSQSEAAGLQSPRASRLWLGELSLLFVLALSLRCAYNYVFAHVNNFASCDAFEYINNAQALFDFFKQPASFWQSCISSLTGNGSAADLQTVKAAFAPLQDFYISGPVYPAILALNIAASGGTVANVHFIWQQLLFGNSIFSALTCVFIALGAYEIFTKREARIAGVLAALYPGFIVNAGRLYSETFACFLLTALCYLTVRGFRDGGNNLLLVFISGFLASALQLTRSVMSALSLVLIPITALQQKGLKRIAFLLPFVLGFALLALPWLGFQKLAFGGGGLVVNRVGQYNFFIGNNVDTQGWLSYPYPDGRNVEAQSFPYLLKTAVAKSPSRWLRLMLDKPLRLFKFPWNDFRTAIGAVEFKWQVVYHELLVLLACLGLGLSLFLSPLEPTSKKQLCGRLFIAGLLVFHLIYNLFITVPRYNLTGMPEMIIFAAGALGLILSGIKSEQRRKAFFLPGSLILLFVLLRSDLVPFFAYLLPVQAAWIAQAILRTGMLIASAVAAIAFSQTLFGKRKLAVLTTSLIALCFVPLLLLPLRANGRTQEWHTDLRRTSAPLKQTLHLPLSAAQGQCYILLDTDGVRQFTDGFKLQLNGRDLTGPVLPSMCFAEDFDRFLALGPNSVQREGERMWDSLVNSVGSENLDLRQWSMIALPAELIRDAAEQAKQSRSDSLALELVISNSSNKPLRVFGSYDTGAKERILPSVSVYSWEKVFYGVENPEGLTDTRYDIKVPASTLEPAKEDLSDNAGLQNGVINAAVLVAPSSAAGQSFSTIAGCLKLDPVSEVKSETGKNIPVDLKQPWFPKDSISLLHLRGRCRLFNGSACPQAEIETRYKRKDGTEFSYKSAWNPKRLAASKEWKEFEFVFPVKTSVDGSEAVSANLNLRITSPGSPYLNVEQKFSGEAEFDSLRLNIIALPSNPIGLGHQVF